MAIRNVLQEDLARILAAQAALALATLAAVAWWRGPGAAPAALYGAAVAALLAWRLQRGLAALAAAAEPGTAAGALGAAALGRLALAGAAFAVGIGALRLEALPMLLAYGACQLGYPLAALARA